MILQISDDDSIILKSLIWDNYQKERYETVDLYLRLEKGHLYIIPNGGGVLKIKDFKYIKGESLKKAREVSLEGKPKKHEGICLDLNLRKDSKPRKHKEVS